MRQRLHLGMIAASATLLIAAAVYKRWSDDLAWGVCRVAAWRSFGGGPLPVRPDSLVVSGWDTVRDIEAVYLLPEGRGYVGCTMTWDREMGWFPHELVSHLPSRASASSPAHERDAPRRF
jgi:hypothetical protein